jgi:hypothetical protein
VQTPKLSENGVSGANSRAPPSLYWPKTAGSRLRLISCRPVVLVSHGRGPVPDLLDRAFAIERIQLQRDPPHEVRAGLRIVLAVESLVLHRPWRCPQRRRSRPPLTASPDLAVAKRVGAHVLPLVGQFRCARCVSNPPDGTAMQAKTVLPSVPCRTISKRGSPNLRVSKGKGWHREV